MNKKAVRPYALLFIIAVFISSCSIQKRHYMPGYEIVWNKTHVEEKPKNKIKLTDELQKEEQALSLEFEEENITASIEANDAQELATTDKEIHPIIKKKKKLTLNTRNNECDEIILKDGQIIKGKVLELSDTEIKYKKCDNMDGPTISTNKKNVFMIKYANGNTDVINKISTDNNEKSATSDNKKTEPLAIAAIVSVGLALLAMIGVATELALLALGLAALCALLAIIFGIMALVKIRKNKDTLKGKSLAWIGIIGGVLFLFLIFGSLFIFDFL